MRRSTAYGLSAANPGLLPLIPMSSDEESRDDYDVALEAKVDAVLEEEAAARRQVHWWVRLWHKIR